jgi:hypothetical protein
VDHGIDSFENFSLKKLHLIDFKAISQLICASLSFHFDPRRMHKHSDNRDTLDTTWADVYQVNIKNVAMAFERKNSLSVFI